MEVKFRSQASIALNRVTAHLQVAQKTIAGLGRGAANKLLEARRTRGMDLRKFLDNSLDAITVANGKITKFRSQASIALNKVTAHLQVAQKTIAGLGRGAANKLLEVRRTRGIDLRKFLDNSLDAITVANGKITKFRSQASIALNKVTAHLQVAQKTIAGLGRGAANKLLEARRTRGIDLRKFLDNSLDAITVANGKITKFRSQASIALNKVTAHLQVAQKTIAGLGRGAANKLLEARRTRGIDLRKFLDNSLDAITVANGKITKFRSQASIALNKVTAHLQVAQKTIAGLARGAANKLLEARRTRGIDLRKFLDNSLDAITVANGKITKFRSQASIALNKVTAHLQGAQKTIAGLARRVINKSRRLQEARRTKENDLRELLENSLDAIVVTSGDRGLVSANPKALDLFGVSELNMRKFTIDTFLSPCQIPELRRRWFPLRQDERHGKCKIRRLDGSLRAAEYILVADVIPHRYLYRFLNVAPSGITQLRSRAKMPISYAETTLGNQVRSSRSEKFTKSWLVN